MSDEFEELPFVGLIPAYFIDGVLVPMFDCPVGHCDNKRTGKYCRWYNGLAASPDGNQVTTCSRYDLYSKLSNLCGIFIKPYAWGVSPREICDHILKVRPVWA